MSQVIEAVFENGVFRPLHPIEMPEREIVSIKIISSGEWQSRFNRIIEKIHKNAEQYPSAEIEEDILAATKEVRNKTHGDQGCY